MAEDELLEAFDAGDDMGAYFDFAAATRPNVETRKVNVDMPVWMINALDQEAARMATNRQAVIKRYIDDGLRLDAERRRDACERA